MDARGNLEATKYSDNDDNSKKQKQQLQQLQIESNFSFV